MSEAQQGVAPRNPAIGTYALIPIKPDDSSESEEEETRWLGGD